MKRAGLGACLFLLAACNAEKPADTAATGAAAAASGGYAENAAAMAGRWGLTPEACAPTNDARDGVIEITATTVQIGLDVCTITAQAPEGMGVRMTTACKAGEGEDYTMDRVFVSSTPDTLTWTQKEDGSAEPYVRCE